MQFLKKHYEKIILILVLLPLFAAAGLIFFKRGEIEDQINRQVTPPSKPKAYTPLDLSTNKTVVAQLEKGVDVQLSGPHNLFNPVLWVKSSGGQPIKVIVGDELGPKAVQIDKIEPLYTVIEFSDVAGSEDRFRYEFYVTREADSKRANRRRRLMSLRKGEKNDVFLLREVVGIPESPGELVLEIGNGYRVSVTKDKPFKAVAGYSADLRYDPEKKTKTGVREGDSWSFAGDTYNIVAIQENEVLLSAESTQKRTTITWKSSK